MAWFCGMASKPGDARETRQNRAGAKKTRKRPDGGNSVAESLLDAHLRAAGLNGYEREHQFAKHLGRRWRFDFSWSDHMVAIEVEGGTWIAGRHSRGAGFQADCEKYAEAVLLGWRVLRVTPAMIRDGRALRFAEALLKTASVPLMEIQCPS